MNFLQNLGLQAGTGINGYNAMLKNTLANQLAQQGVTSGQATLDGQTLAGMMLPQILQAGGMPGMSPMNPTGMNPNQTPPFLPPAAGGGMPPQGGPQTMTPPTSATILDLFGNGGQQPPAGAIPGAMAMSIPPELQAPMAGPSQNRVYQMDPAAAQAPMQGPPMPAPQQQPMDFTTAMMSAPPPTGAMPGAPAQQQMYQPQPGGMSAPTPISMPGAERYNVLAQLLNQRGTDFSPAARMAAAQQILTTMNPQDRLMNQQLLQDMRNETAQQRIEAMLTATGMRNNAMLGATGMRVDATNRNADMREPDNIDALKFQADNLGKDHRALVTMYSYNPTPENAAKVEAARAASEAAMNDYRQAIAAKGTVPAAPTAATGAPGLSTAPAPKTTVPTIKSDADYEALAPGTTFIDPKGVQRTKPQASTAGAA